MNCVSFTKIFECNNFLPHFSELDVFSDRLNLITFMTVASSFGGSNQNERKKRIRKRLFGPIGGATGHAHVLRWPIRINRRERERARSRAHREIESLLASTHTEGDISKYNIHIGEVHAKEYRQTLLSCPRGEQVYMKKTQVPRTHGHANERRCTRSNGSQRKRESPKAEGGNERPTIKKEDAWIKNRLHKYELPETLHLLGVGGTSSFLFFVLYVEGVYVAIYFLERERECCGYMG